ncbi:MAG: MCP four helix bundle domain-containing protein [Chitinophagaceae bacterium]|nr:MCP four helix bundle domain-containing protein [Chitinophagaceae bacterium]
MKWHAVLGEKRKIVAFLLIVLLLGLINNYFSRKYYNNLDKNMASLYNDRLMPASYLFKISDRLYQKKLLLEDNGISKELLRTELKQHDLEIENIIADYRKTYLTNAEESQWNKFLLHLESYNTAEAAFLTASDRDVQQEKVIQSSFKSALMSLNELNDIQTSEGALLQIDSHNLITSTLLQAYLEVSLLFIMGIAVLMLLVIPEKAVYPVSHRYLFN